MKNIAVMGSGSWGTALAILLHNNGHRVTLWSFLEKECVAINRDRENKEFLPGIDLPDDIEVTNDKEYALKEKDLIVIAIPSSFIRTNIEDFKPFITEDQIIVNVSKGLEQGTLLRLSEVINVVLPNNPVAVLSGPSHAEEVAMKVPTTCTVSSISKSTAESVQKIFMNDYFRLYTNPDLVGVELGGALKNVIALAAGISDGLGYGDNTKAALMTRGITEISRLGTSMGADFQTFNGLSGVGDLIVTCTSMHSRNRRAGILLGKGKKLEDTLNEVHMVVEGVHTAKVAMEFARQYEVEMPIIENINKILIGEVKPKEAVKRLMNRDRKSEDLSNNLITEKSVKWLKD